MNSCIGMCRSWRRRLRRRTRMTGNFPWVFGKLWNKAERFLKRVRQKERYGIPIRSGVRAAAAIALILISAVMISVNTDALSMERIKERFYEYTQVIRKNGITRRKKLSWNSYRFIRHMCPKDMSLRLRISSFSFKTGNWQRPLIYGGAETIRFFRYIQDIVKPIQTLHLCIWKTIIWEMRNWSRDINGSCVRWLGSKSNIYNVLTWHIFDNIILKRKVLMLWQRLI